MAKTAITSGCNVFIVINGNRIPCLVAQLGDRRKALIPLGNYPDLQKVSKGACIQIEAEGSKTAFRLQENAVVPALVGIIEMQDPSQPANRQHYRTKINLFIEVSEDEKYWRTVKTLDVSEGGFLAEDNSPICPRVGQVLYLRMNDSKGAISARGIIRRAEPGNGTAHRIAIQITQISASDIQRLVQLVYKHQTEAPQSI